MTEEPSSDFHRFVRYYNEEYPVTDCIQMFFEGCLIRVDLNSRELGSYLRKYYQNFLTTESNVPSQVIVTVLETPPFEQFENWQRKPPEPGKKRVKEEYQDFPEGRIIRKRNTGLVFFVSPRTNLVVGTCREHPNQVVNFINNRYIQWMLWRGHLLFHASGVSRKGRGLALCGFAGRGKSTLALHLVGEGLDFVSNDRLLVRQQDDESIWMHGIPKLPRVNPGTIVHNPYLSSMFSREKYEYFRKKPSECLWTLEEKYDVDIGRVFGKGRFSLSARFAGMGILNWQQRGGNIRIERIDITEQKEVFRTFMKSPGLFFEAEPGKPYPDLSPSRYMDILKDVPVFEVTGGVDFAKATAFFSHFLE